MRVTKQRSTTKAILLAAATILERNGRPRKRPGKPRYPKNERGQMTTKQAILRAAQHQSYCTSKATLSRARHAAIRAFEEQYAVEVEFPDEGGAHVLGPVFTTEWLDDHISDTREIIRALRAAARTITA